MVRNCDSRRAGSAFMNRSCSVMTLLLKSRSRARSSVHSQVLALPRARMKSPRGCSVFVTVGVGPVGVSVALAVAVPLAVGEATGVPSGVSVAVLVIAGVGVIVDVALGLIGSAVGGVSVGEGPCVAVPVAVTDLVAVGM